MANRLDNDDSRVGSKREIAMVLGVILAPIVFFVCVQAFKSVHQDQSTLVFFGIPAIIIAAIALVVLGSRRLSDTAAAIWAFIILLFPFLGAFAFALVAPRPERLTEQSLGGDSENRAEDGTVPGAPQG